MKTPRFEVRWYEIKNCKDSLRAFYHIKEFLTRGEAIAFYNEHCNENGKFGWCVVQRNPDWYIIGE